MRSVGKAGADDATLGGADFLKGFKIQPKGFRWMDPKAMEPHPLNWKIHPENQIGEIERSMDEFGWVPSMLGLFNERTGRVIDAHGRREACIKMGRQMPVVVIDVDERTEGRLLASLDKVGELRGTDAKALAELLKSFDGAEMPAGYDSESLDQLLAALAIPSQLPPLLDADSMSSPDGDSREVYEVGEEVACPKCGHEFKLP